MVRIGKYLPSRGRSYKDATNEVHIVNTICPETRGIALPGLPLAGYQTGTLLLTTISTKLCLISARHLSGSTTHRTASADSYPAPIRFQVKSLHHGFHASLRASFSRSQRYKLADRLAQNSSLIRASLKKLSCLMRNRFMNLNMNSIGKGFLIFCKF